ncbi:hypothetical protein KCP70_01460 [Salmonella enterica subsp. enterica]|nr:hypothetical protein KCP70_01460 [Salmonella enterica subsp. enterica]
MITALRFQDATPAARPSCGYRATRQHAGACKQRLICGTSISAASLFTAVAIKIIKQSWLCVFTLSCAIAIGVDIRHRIMRAAAVRSPFAR